MLYHQDGGPLHSTPAHRLEDKVAREVTRWYSCTFLLMERIKKEIRSISVAKIETRLIQLQNPILCRMYCFMFLVILVFMVYYLCQ